MTQAPASLQRAWTWVRPAVAIVVLTVMVTVMAAFPWPRPERAMTSFWQVSDVPPALWALLLGTAVVCMSCAVILGPRDAGVRPRDAAVVAWKGLLLLATGALVWNALYAAALSVTFHGGLIPIFHWLFTFVPAVLAGGLFGSRGRATRWAAALGTGVVTVPMFHLFSVLLVPPDRPLEARLSSFSLTAALAVIPFLVGVALVAAPRARPPGRRAS